MLRYHRRAHRRHPDLQAAPATAEQRIAALETELRRLRGEIP
ncbi:hypothetical protein [Roseiflexus castenholzii]